MIEHEGHLLFGAAECEETEEEAEGRGWYFAGAFVKKIK